MNNLRGGRFAIKSESRVFTDRLREISKNIIDPAASFLLKIGLTPNMVTMIGCAGHIGAAFLAATGRFTWAGLVILLTAPMDALDGAMARQKGIKNKFGAFFDSVMDRYSEFFLYGGLLIYFVSHEEIIGSLLVFFAMMGSIMVSYTRARAESLGFNARIGLLSRVERYFIMIPTLLFKLVYIGLGILAVFTNVTAIQRIMSVNRQASESVTSNEP